MKTYNRSIFSFIFLTFFLLIFPQVLLSEESLKESSPDSGGRSWTISGNLRHGTLIKLFDRTVEGEVKRMVAIRRDNGLIIIPPFDDFSEEDRKFLHDFELNKVNSGGKAVKIDQGDPLAGRSILTESAAGQKNYGRAEFYAILIGVNSYPNLPSNFQLSFCVQDTERLGKTLIQNGFPPENVFILTETEGNLSPTKETIEHQLSSLLQLVSPNDTVVVGFSGHGLELKELGNQAFLCPSDTPNPTNDIPQSDYAKALVSRDLVFGLLNASAARNRLFIIDACRNDPFFETSAAGNKSTGAKNVGALSNPLGTGDRQFYMMASCKPGQLSFERPEFQSGLFTHYLIEGLAGYADIEGTTGGNRDGSVTVKEAFDYAQDRTRKYEMFDGSGKRVFQNPVDFSNHFNDGFVIAKVPSYLPALPASVPPKPAPFDELTKESYRLQQKLLSVKTKVEKANYDRGDGFGTRLDSFSSHFEMGETALRNKDYSVAVNFFIEAETAGSWLLEMGAARASLIGLKSSVSSARASAIAMKAEQLSPVALSDIDGQVKSAETALSSGNFLESRRLYEESVLNYGKLQKSCFETRIEIYLELSRDAASRGDWSESLSQAKLILGLDESNSLAKRLIAMAERELANNHAKLSKSHLNAKDYVKAKLEIEKALKYFPNDAGYKMIKASIEAAEKPVALPPSAVSQPGSWIGNKAGERKVLTIKGIEYAFHWCPSGKFTMGSPAGELGRFGTEMQHEVTLTKDFWMLETEVTQLMWESVMGSNPSYFKGEKLPVETVSWDDCQEFIMKLNSLSDATPAGLKFSLPSEAQWEYACRAGTRTSLSSGKNITSEEGTCPNLTELGWYDRNSDSEPHAVRGKKANAWGLFDMYGNVWEWCLDRYGSYWSGSVTDPVGADNGPGRVNRGGCWSNYAKYCRSAFRNGCAPGYQDYAIGLRICLIPRF